MELVVAGGALVVAAPSRILCAAHTTAQHCRVQWKYPRLHPLISSRKNGSTFLLHLPEMSFATNFRNSKNRL